MVISTGVILDAGKAAVFTKNLDFSLARRYQLQPHLGNANSTSNRLGLAPPPVSLLLKSLIFLNGGMLLNLFTG